MLGFRWQVLPVMAVQVILYAVSFIPNAHMYLAITPGRLLAPNFWLWTLVTFSFFNHSIFLLCSDLMTMFLLESFLSVYSWMELLTFCAFVNLVTGLITVTLLFIEYAITFDTDLLFSANVCGILALLGGITVVGRQMMGDKLLLDFPLGKIRQKHIPFMCFLTAVALRIAQIIGQVSFCMFTGGIIVAWIYLRFIQKHSNEPPIAIVSNTVYGAFVKLKICADQPSRRTNKKSIAPVMPFILNVREHSLPGDKE
ncbi:unnamed protein product [Echinostoma caproni]|uniref:Transmembrane protein 115 n=1 Tax=Echinostoma caproni TaxID=27848 RepID=A0A183A1D0_9TREM|nr:unnamed protein product [Echinostoma caproni]